VGAIFLSAGEDSDDDEFCETLLVVLFWQVVSFDNVDALDLVRVWLTLHMILESCQNLVELA
jgi:hypothetical protein